MTQIQQPPFFFTPDELSRITIVGISGKLGSGKTTMGKYLIEEYGFTPLLFAAELKLKGVIFEKLPFREVFGPSEAKSAHTRKRMQLLGTEEGRDVYGKDVWLRCLELAMFMAFDAGVRRFVITDARFENEVEFIHQLGGKVYRLTGRGGATGEAALHSSETALDNYTGFDAYLNNAPVGGTAYQQLRTLLGTDYGLVRKAA